jgi:hypothetical protein
MGHYIFPIGGDPSFNSVKDWIHFYAADYSTFSANRIPNSIIERAHTIISLPYPGVFNTLNQQDYSALPTPQIKSVEYAALGGLGGLLASLSESLTATVEKTESFFRGGNVMTFDHMETVLQPGGRRTHQFEFNLIAKNEMSAVEATNIALAFQTLLHPGANTQSIYSMTHPSLWLFTAGPQVTNLSYNPNKGALDGLGLPSVLVSVDINRAPVQNIPYTLKTSAIPSVPLAHNIKLNFVELEPALKLNEKTLISRSQRG